MRELGQALGYPFPYLFDEDQSVAKKYKAACTPDIYAFDGNLACAYHGQLDDARPGNGQKSNGVDLRKALDAILEERPMDFEVKPSIGCGIKWKN